MITWITIGVGLVGVTMAGISWPRLRDARLARRLHADFAHANSLTESESNWLWEVAQRKSAADPLSIFVVPSVFDALVDAEAAPAGRVRSKLFD